MMKTRSVEVICRHGKCPECHNPTEADFYCMKCRLAFLRDNGWVGPKEAAESRSRESALWACIEMLWIQWARSTIGGPVPLNMNIKNRNLPALCKRLGVEVENE